MEQTNMRYKQHHEDNRWAWNAATSAHNSHKADQAKFLREGGSTLYPEEIELLGDISGLSLVHLQCNAGQDSLSLAARGANVTGVDISDTAIEFARKLSAETGIPATFHRCDVYDWLDAAASRSEQYDIAFSSYGALPWLSDIGKWAKGVASILKPGGRLVVVEFHPIAMLYEGDWGRNRPYFGKGQVVSFESGIGDYVGWTGAIAAPSGYVEGVQNFQNPHPGHEWQWGIGEILTALIEANLTLTAFKEYPYANGFRPFEEMTELPGGRMTLPDGTPNFPLMFAFAARK
jgi:SAM-dependent methyltransferase